MNDIAMLAADTSRTKYYVTQLIKNNLQPAYVLVLLNSGSELLPGQKESGFENELVKLLLMANIKYDVAPTFDINSPEVIMMISNRSESVFIFSGFGGTLLEDKVLSTGKFFLHVHGGYLPDYKGSTTNYYSLINENTIGASSIFLSHEIDCGPVLLRRKFIAPLNRKDMDHVHDSEARSKVLIETLNQYLDSGGWSFEFKKNQGGETYYIIHPVLKAIAIFGE